MDVYQFFRFAERRTGVKESVTGSPIVEYSGFHIEMAAFYSDFSMQHVVRTLKTGSDVFVSSEQQIIVLLRPGIVSRAGPAATRPAGMKEVVV
jgi:hypothetical protein